MKKQLKKIKFIKDRYDRFRISSIKQAVKQQNLKNILSVISAYPIENHYGTSIINTAYIWYKVKALHAFQVSLINEALKNEYGTNVEKIVDLGDSSGLHLLYTKEINLDILDKRDCSYVGVNIDGGALKKIEDKGFRAIYYDIEEAIFKYEDFVDADYVFMFETLEHLNNPATVLRKIKEDINPKALIITVPFVRGSRVGIEKTSTGKINLTPEDVHIFELSPKDWGQLFTYAEWTIDYEQVYYQYKRNLMTNWFWRWYWEYFDYEGFIGYVLK